MALIRRKDSRGRVLHDGESERKDGIYQYRYTHNGKRYTVYAANLAELREKEKEIHERLNSGVDYASGAISTLELVRKCVDLKQGARYTTRVSYDLALKRMKNEEFCQIPIRDVLTSTAKEWIKKLYYEDGYSYSTVINIKGIVNLAYQMAYEEDVIRKNPFNFRMRGLIPNNTKQKEALTEEEIAKWLDFLKNDTNYRQYYDEMVVLAGTGLRVSEFCGLTLSDLDFKNRRIRVERQLRRTIEGQYFIERPKTKNGSRFVPMTDVVTNSLRCICSARTLENDEYTVDGVSGFLLMKNGKPKVAANIQSEITGGLRKFQKNHKGEKFPHVSAHILRHTFCTNMANRGMAVKNLQYIMGHSNVGTTLNIYTHSGYDEAARDMLDKCSNAAGGI